MGAATGNDDDGNTTRRDEMNETQYLFAQCYKFCHFYRQRAIIPVCTLSVI